MDDDTLEFARKNFPNLAAVIEGKVVQVSAQDMHDALRAIRELRELLRLIQTDRGNWLHSDLQARIEAVVGPPGPWRPD